LGSRPGKGKKKKEGGEGENYNSVCILPTEAATPDKKKGRGKGGEKKRAINTANSLPVNFGGRGKKKGKETTRRSVFG